MSKAYVDTTILTDALLKPGPLGKAAKAALRRFDVTELPTYAIKEFKAGPLKNFVWMHNKLATYQSFNKALDALQRMSLSPKRYTTATAIGALSAAADSIGKLTGPELTKKYGRIATFDSMVCDEFRLMIKVAVYKAWKRRRSVTTRVVQPLTCYKEVAPFEERGLLVLEPTKCDANPECCLALDLKSSPGDLTKLKGAIPNPSPNREHQRRYQTLRQLIRKPKEPMTDGMCRNMGDANFAFFAPMDSVILTTNTKDHEPLATALGKKVEST